MAGRFNKGNNKESTRSTVTPPGSIGVSFPTSKIKRSDSAL